MAYGGHPWMTSRLYGEGGQGFNDNGTEALVLKSVTIGGEGGFIKKCPQFCNVIYGRPLISIEWIYIR